jgi:DUF4097 and DUF4098 domain-containing protein YvlB
MSRRGREHEEPRRGDDANEGIGGFLRNLLSGIPWSECAECREERTFPAPSGRSLRIDNGSGRTRVLGEDRDDISVCIEKRARAESDDAAQHLVGDIQLVARETNGVLHLEVQTPRRWNRHGNAHLEVRIPRDLEVAVNANNGKVCIEGIRSRVSARSCNGSIRVSDVVGDIDVTTSNAKVCFHCTCGQLTARSSNGKIELDEHRGSVDVSTSNGLIRAALDEVGRQGVILATSNGRIMLELPEHVDAEVDLRVDNGVIRTLRELETSSGEDTGRLRGRLGRGGIPIKLRTSNGTISLR